jgi:PKD repeat protein
MMNVRIRPVLVLTLALMPAACTISNTTPPPLTGPSEMSLSLAITATPDVLSLDGASQSQIAVEARDAHGQLLANSAMRAEIWVAGVNVDYGSLSARTIVTGSNGRATLVYTAPMGSAGSPSNVSVQLIPATTDAANSFPRVVNIRLIPPGVVTGGAPTAQFTFQPEAPLAATDVRFDASTSTPALGAVITSYSWSFGDGGSGTGVNPTHRFRAGSYNVRLRVTDNFGESSTKDQVITVEAGDLPTAVVVFSPDEPTVGDTVFFNGGLSSAGPGYTIVRYRWNFGDGNTASGSTVSHVFSTPGIYNVVLTVTDTAGQTNASTSAVDVAP